VSTDTVRVTIVKWEKFNSRNDVKSAHWFRLNHDLFENPEFYDFTHSELLFWIYLLSLASKKSDATVVLNRIHAKRVGKFTSLVIDRSLKKLETLGIIQCAMQNPAATLQDRQDRQDKHPHSDFLAKLDLALEAVYQRYPRKLGKQEGMKKARREIQSPDDLAGLNRALARFNAHHAAKQTATDYIPYFSTFMSSWKDWLDPDAGKERTPPPVRTQDLPPPTRVAAPGPLDDVPVDPDAATKMAEIVRKAFPAMPKASGE
jgi:hypothetical protein